MFRRTVQIAPNFLHWNAHIFLFDLILRDIPNSITPQTTLRLLPIPVGLLVLPCTCQCRRPPLLPSPFFSCPGQRNWRRSVPVPVTGVRYNSLLWMCTLNTLTWPDPYKRASVKEHSKNLVNKTTSTTKTKSSGYLRQGRDYIRSDALSAGELSLPRLHVAEVTGI